jgi:undecaprenyl-diphosphatase
MQSSPSFLKRYFSKIPLALVLLVLLIGTAVFFFGFIINEVLLEKEQQVDDEIFRYFSSHIISPGLTPIMKTISYFASSTFLPFAYLFVIGLYLGRKNFKRIVEILVIGFVGFLIIYLMKLAFHRPRPLDPLIDPLHNFSFPSGHATSGFIFYGLVSYLVWKTGLSKKGKIAIAVLLICFSLLIGFSRVYLRVHYASDVAAGLCIGFSWLLISIGVLEFLKKKADREVTSGEESQLV